MERKASRSEITEHPALKQRLVPVANSVQVVQSLLGNIQASDDGGVLSLTRWAIFGQLCPSMLQPLHYLTADRVESCQETQGRFYRIANLDARFSDSSTMYNLYGFAQQRAFYRQPVPSGDGSRIDKI